MDGKPKDEWIGVEEVAAEMKYTPRQAWEFIRRIGLRSVNSRRMELARFTRADLEEAREWAKAPLAPRALTGALASVVSPRAAVKPPAYDAARIAALRAQVKKA